MEQGRPESAANNFERALALRPDLAETHYNLGTALKDQGRLDEAVNCFERALAINPGYAEAHNKLASVRKEQGKFDEARRHYERALTLDRTLAEAHWNRASLKTYRVGDADLAALEALATDPALLPAKLPYVHFALAKAYEDLGQFDRAFEHLLSGNTLKRRGIDYDPTRDEQLLRRIAAAFDANLLDRFRAAGDPSPLPIFILGMPRSGSTLIEQILASHPLVQGGGELGNIGRITRGTFQSAGRQLLSRVRFRVRFRQPETAGPDLPGRPAPPGGRQNPNHRQGAGEFPRRRSDPLDFAQCQNHPQPARSDQYLPFLLLEPVREGHHFSHDLAELGRYFRHYRELMDHWHAVLPPDTMLDLRYEDLVEDLEGQVRRLLDFCGLPWDDQCLSFHQTDRPVATASNVQVRQPLYRGSVQALAPLPKASRSALGRAGWTGRAGRGAITVAPPKRL